MTEAEQVCQAGKKKKIVIVGRPSFTLGSAS